MRSIYFVMVTVKTGYEFASQKLTPNHIGWYEERPTAEQLKALFPELSEGEIDKLFREDVLEREWESYYVKNQQQGKLLNLDYLT